MKKYVQKNKIILLSLLFLLITGVIFTTFSGKRTTSAQDMHKGWWEVQSVDTMKYSRDLAAEKLNDEAFDEEIESQIKLIAAMGATHVAIATPYDEKFIPYLTRWVDMARKYDLNVWFRGNFSGWERWFNYEGISRDEHARLLKEFILKNPSLFSDGDIFTSCPECENGGPGDPRRTGDTEGFRNFLIDEYEITKNAFENIGKDVESNYYSMNGDVARLIMDKQTTNKLDGVIVVDHYVSSVEKLSNDIKNYAISSGGKVVLGETGVPIPDIHGDLSENEQKQWYEDALYQISQEESLTGLNYWTLKGGSTTLVNEGNTPREIVQSIESYFKPEIISLNVKNEIDNNIHGAKIQYGTKESYSDLNGKTQIKIIPSINHITVSADGYKDLEVSSDSISDGGKIVLEREKETILFSLIKQIHKLLN